jgi:outer membrane receptor protein involved in Fe transport
VRLGVFGDRLLARPYLLLFAFLGFTASAISAQVQRPIAGRFVESVLDELRAQGAPLVYSSALVPAWLVVETEPAAATSLELAREVLSPHGLDVRVEGGTWLVVRAEPRAPASPGALALEVGAAYAGEPVAVFEVDAEGPVALHVTGADGRAELSPLVPGRYAVTVRAAGFLPQRLAAHVEPGATTALSVGLVESVPKLEELVVTASRYDVANEVRPSATYFSQQEVESLPLLGDDTLRVAQRLPGVTGNGFSARPYVRGGGPDEVAVLLDGVRLVEPYHLRDFQAVFSAVDQRIVDRVAVHAGGFSAEYGDALSGLMLIDSREPQGLEHELGLSVLYSSLLSSGRFAGGRASWLVSVRDSNLDRVLADHLGQPAYSDVFVRVSADIGDRHKLLFGDLSFNDDILLTPQGDEMERAASDTDSRQAWLELDSEWGERLSSSTWLATTDFRSRRREDVADPAELIGFVDDDRELASIAVRQRWRYEPNDRQLARFGFEAERFDAEYRYSSAANRLGLLATLDGPDTLLRNLAMAPDGASYALYFEDRLRVTERVIADLGLRWDRYDYLPESEADGELSPRLSLLVRLGGRTDLRVSHGRFFQAEGLANLQVEDGVTEFAPAQRSTHSIVSVEHRLAGTVALRAEWYEKRTRHVRPRFENLFEPLVVAPELRSSRVLVAPERADADGLELTVSGARPVSWWAGLSLANADDRIAGNAVPRGWDQERAFNAGVIWPAGRWTVSAAATLHRGWPVTELEIATDAAGEPIIVAGPRHATRLPSVRRLDFRVSREFTLGGTALRFLSEIANLTNRANPCCVAYSVAMLRDGSPALARDERSQGGVTGNVGVLWRF